MTEWRPHTSAEALARAARDWPDQQAVLCDGRSLTYRAYREAARLVAANLKRLGVGHGDHVAICMGNSVDWAVLMQAAGMLGAVTVPVNTRFKPDELAYCLRQADIKLLAVNDRFLKIDFIEMLRQICPAIDGTLPDPALPRLATMVVFGTDVPKGALPASELEKPAAVLPDEASEGVKPTDVLLIQYTSGTTAYPKGAMLTHQGMLRNAYEFGRRIGVGQGDRYFSGRPLFHVSGTTQSLMSSLELGACYITVPNFDVAEVLDILEREGCTQTTGNDTMFLMMMNHPSFPGRRFKLRSGLAAASPAVMKQIAEKMGMPGVCSGYGLSEGSGNSGCTAFDAPLEKRLSGLIQPLPGLEYRIKDPNGDGTLPPGQPGEILLRGWSLMKGYYNMPERTAEAIDPDGWLHTGDLGLIEADGWFRFIGRLKDTFRVGGENVSPADVEEVMHRHPKIRQAQVIGVPEPRLGEVAAAYVILREGEAAEPDEIIAWCKERLANFKVPRYVRFVTGFDDIGMTASSKIQKRKLRAFAVKDLGLEEVA